MSFKFLVFLSLTLGHVAGVFFLSGKEARDKSWVLLIT